nr:MAG TPA: hypothetical protein [Caudoviricetes sp.]
MNLKLCSLRFITFSFMTVYRTHAGVFCSVIIWYLL